MVLFFRRQAASCLLLLYSLTVAGAATEGTSCTSNLKRADANKDGKLSEVEFTKFLETEASSNGKRSGNVELKCQSSEAKKELRALFTSFADETNTAIDIGAIETDGDRESIPAQERAVLGLLCARCKSFVSKHSSIRTEKKTKEEAANNPFYGERLFPSNKQGDFDLDVFQFNFAGVIINADIAQERCPSQWQSTVSCLISDCPTFLDVCPESEVSEVSDGTKRTVAPSSMGNFTGNMTNGSMEGSDEPMPETIPVDAGDAADEIPTCEELDAAFCQQFKQEEYEDCCMIECIEAFHELVICLIMETTGEDRSNCETPECPNPTPGSTDAPAPAPVPSDSVDTDTGSGDQAGSGDNLDVEFEFEIEFLGQEYSADTFQLQCPDQLSDVTNCVIRACPQFLDVCPDGLTTGGSVDGDGDSSSSDGNLTVPECPDFVDRACQSLAFPEGCCLKDCKYELYDLMLCSVNKTAGVDRSNCSVLDSCLDPTGAFGLGDGLGDSDPAIVSEVWVNSSFLISNLEGITAAKLREELQNGNDSLLGVLQESFRAFVQSVVDTVLAPPGRKLGLSQEPGPTPTGSNIVGRILTLIGFGLGQPPGPEPTPTGSNIVGRILTSIGFDQQSAQVYDFEDAPCSSLATPATGVSRQGANNMTCIAAFGKYRIDVDPQDTAAANTIYDLFDKATQAGISEGKLEETVQQIAQETNSDTIFVVEGVSTVVDESFKPFQPQAEMVGEDSAADADPPVPAPVATANETSAGDSQTAAPAESAGDPPTAAPVASANETSPPSQASQDVATPSPTPSATSNGTSVTPEPGSNDTKATETKSGALVHSNIGLAMVVSFLAIAFSTSVS